MKKIASHLVPDQPNPQRLSDYVPGIFEMKSSKKGMKKAIENGLVKINGRTGRTGDFISGGEIIELFQSKESLRKPVARITIEVCYQDEHLAIIEKPAGIVVSGNKLRTLENALPHNLKKSDEKDALPRPEPVHRLDFPTSGLLIIAKTTSSLRRLNDMFSNREIHKEYMAVTTGPMDKKGEFTSSIKDKTALTAFEVIQTIPSDKYGVINLVKLLPLTGRRHQIRIHLAQSGHPIMGDKTYGIKGAIVKGKGLFLHATHLSFAHPVTGETVEFSSELPKKFSKIFQS